MIVSTKVAKTKWCSEVKAGRNSWPDDEYKRLDFDERTEEFHNGIVLHSLCIANKCMSWRWSDDTHKEGFCGRAGVPILENKVIK